MSPSQNKTTGGGANENLEESEESSSSIEELRKNPLLGGVLKDFRQRVKMSQQEVVDEVCSLGGDLSHAWYSKIETRKGSYPSGENLERILQVIGSNKEEIASALDSEDFKEDSLAEPSLPDPGIQAKNLFYSAPQTNQLNYFSEANDSLWLQGNSIQPAASPSLNSSLQSINNPDFSQVYIRLNEKNQKSALAYARSLLHKQERNSKDSK